MKKTFVCAAVLGAFLIAGPIAFAQQDAAKQQKKTQPKKADPKKVQENYAADRIAGLDETVALTPEQKKKIEPIVQEEAQKLTKIQLDASINRLEKHKQRSAVSDEALTKIKTHLTPDQIKKLDRKGLKNTGIPDKSGPTRYSKPADRQ